MQTVIIFKFETKSVMESWTLHACGETSVQRVQALNQANTDTFITIQLQQLMSNLNLNNFLIFKTEVTNTLISITSDIAGSNL